MPGIAGLIDFASDTRAIDSVARRMGHFLGSLSGMREEYGMADCAGMVSVRAAHSPVYSLVGEDSQVLLAFWGYLWDREEVARAVGGAGEVDAGALLRLYHNRGIRGFCGLNGRYVLALWVRAENTLYLVNDRHGFCPLYYWKERDRILFASEYKSISFHEEFRKSIDLQGVGDFITFGHSTGDRTFFDNVKLLPQASIATFKRGGAFSVEKYWDYSFYSDEDPFWSENDYVDQFYEMLTMATRRQLNGSRKIALPLSGGLDSRTLAGLLRKFDCQKMVQAFSYGHQWAFDVAYGRKIARKTSISHDYIPIGTNYLEDRAEEFVWKLEGTVNCLNAHMMLTYPYLHMRRSDAVMTGFFGDIICGTDAFYTTGLKGNPDDETILSKQYPVYTNIMKDKDLKDYVQEQFYKKIQTHAYKAYTNNYNACPSTSRYYRSRHFGILERQRRYTSFNLYVFDSVGEVISPFVDKDFVDFALHMPPHLAIHANIYRKMLIRYFPEVASVPHNDTRLPLNASELRKGLHWRWERLNQNPLVRATIGRKYAKMNDNYMNSDEAVRTGSKDFVMEHIKGNSFFAEYFNMDRVHQMLDDHMCGKVNEYGKITAFLTLSLWHKLFIEGNRPHNA